MVKFFFDKENVPEIKTFSSTLAGYELEANLYYAIEMLDDTQADDLRIEILAEILDIAKEIAEKNWERGCEIAKKNIAKVAAPFNDDLIMDIIDIAIADPQIEVMNKTMGIAGVHCFKQIGDVPEVIAVMPEEGALSLLSLAEMSARSDSKVLSEVRGLRNAIDPSYTLPDGAGFDLH